MIWALNTKMTQIIMHHSQYSLPVLLWQENYWLYMTINISIKMQYSISIKKMFALNVLSCFS